MEIGRISTLVLLTLKYKDKTITIAPPKSLIHLKYTLGRLLGLRLPPSLYIILYENCEVDSSTYDNFISRTSCEISILERETEQSAFIFITSPYIIIIKHPYTNIERLENCNVHWSSVVFSMPRKNPILIAGDKTHEFNIYNYTIQLKLHMQFPRYFFASTVIKEYIYVLGGVSIEGYTNICERYNTNLDQWEYIHSHLGIGKSGMTACQWGNVKVFLFGGLDGVNYSAAVECYDVECGVWKILPITLPWETYYIAVAEVENGVLILGGKDNRECVSLDVAGLTFRNEGIIMQSVECTKFAQVGKRNMCVYYFMNLDGYILSFDIDKKKFEVLHDPKKTAYNN